MAAFAFAALLVAALFGAADSTSGLRLRGAPGNRVLALVSSNATAQWCHDCYAFDAHKPLMNLSFFSPAVAPTAELLAKEEAREKAALDAIMPMIKALAAEAEHYYKDVSPVRANGSLEETTRSEADHNKAVGGHGGGIRFKGAIVEKRDQDGGRGRAELNFLRWALDEPSCVGIVPALVSYHREGNEGWVAMTNLVDGLTAPAIMDIKIGTRTWGTSADPAKAEIEREKAAASTSGSLGLRVVGGTVPDPSGGFRKVGYKYSQDVTNEDELRALLSEFLGSEALRASAMKKVREISAWWSKEVSYAFYGSSFLLAYDTEKKDECRVNLIDFANSEPITEKSQDVSGVATGFETMARVLANLTPLS